MMNRHIIVIIGNRLMPTRHIGLELRVRNTYTINISIQIQLNQKINFISYFSSFQLKSKSSLVKFVAINHRESTMASSHVKAVK